MTEKRFTYWEEDIGQMLIPQCRDNGKTVARSVYECVDLLNAQHERIQELEHQLSTLDGLYVSDKEDMSHNWRLNFKEILCSNDTNGGGDY